MSKSHPFGRIHPQPPQPPMVAVDRFGKMIEVGHVVMFHNGEDLNFEVLSVGPVLNPSIPGGRALQVVLQAQFPVMIQPGTPNRGLVIVAETQARIEARAGKNGQPETPADPSSGIVLTDGGGPGDEVAPRDLADTEPTEG